MRFMCRKDLTPAKAQSCVAELYKLVCGHMKSLVFAHDTSRVLQTLMKLGSHETKDAIFHELKGLLVSYPISLFGFEVILTS